MRLGPWKTFLVVPVSVSVSRGSIFIRESDVRIPNNDAKRSFPAIRMIVSDQGHGSIVVRQYEISLEDCEYNIKTNYGKNIESIELAKFIADLKLIELGYDIEEPFYIGE
jgi:hypothetical protein